MIIIHFTGFGDPLDDVSKVAFAIQNLLIIDEKREGISNIKTKQSPFKKKKSKQSPN